MRRGKSKLSVLVLGAGFGGLEVASILSAKMGERLDLTLIDKSDSFFFGYSKFDIMFGRSSSASVKYSYERIKMPGVKFRQEVIMAIDPHSRSVRTDKGRYDADVLLVALGADYDIAATPGLSEAGDEFYSFRGALLLHEYLTLQGVREHCEISLVLPFELPIPPSYGTSKALLKAFKDKNISYIPEIMVGSIDPASKMAVLDDGSEVAFDLFLGVPEHRVPGVVEESGLVFDEWVPVDRSNMKTKFPNVYAIGDISSVGTPKAGLFAVGAARAAAETIRAEFMGSEYPGPYSGADSCYVQFGEGKVARADVDFFSGPIATGVHQRASRKLAGEKKQMEQEYLSRWFNID